MDDKLLMDIMAKAKTNASEGVKFSAPFVVDDKEERYKKRCVRSEIPKRFQNTTFKEISKRGIPASVQKAYDTAADYAVHFPEHYRKGEGVLMAGDVGRMKTTLACAIAYSVMQQGYGAFFITMPELMDRIVTLSRGSREEQAKFIDRVYNVSLLIIDDLGMEYPSDWVLNKVDAIISHRYNEMKPMIITTNLTPADLHERYLERIFNRLQSTSTLIFEKGESLRKGN